MSKLKLNFDELRIESFVTTSANSMRPRGTVEAFSGTGQTITPELTNCFCACNGSDPASCSGPVSECGGDTCNGSCASCTSGSTC